MHKGEKYKRNDYFIRKLKRGMKITFTWRGKRDLGDEMSPLACRWLDVDEALASSNWRAKI